MSLIKALPSAFDQPEQVAEVINQIVHGTQK